MTEKTEFLGFMFPQIVQRHTFDSILSQQYLYQNNSNWLMCVEVIVCYINVVLRHSVDILKMYLLTINEVCKLRHSKVVNPLKPNIVQTVTLLTHHF